MFRGLSAVTLDSKGRMTMPVCYRAQLQAEDNGRIVITIDTEALCLLLYPYATWEEIEKSIAALPSFNQTTRRIQRLLIGHATDLEIDNNGRCLIPPLLRDYAKLDKHLILVGQGKKIEIWQEELWTEGRTNWLSKGLYESSAEIPAELKLLSL
jgi:MraZ protein